MKVAKPDVQLPALEAQIRAFWDEKKIFQQSLENRKSNPSYRFYDGPPFATGTPHYGHLLAGTIKDIVPRYQTMKGFYLERRFGWDTHGLPIEMIVEKSLDLKGRLKAQGIPDFQAPPPIPKFIDTALAIDDLPSHDSFEPSPDDF